jgi:hypothetical protein
MKSWVCMLLLLWGSPLPAQNKKLEGYVMNPAAFRKIESYCIDTHNLPPDQVKVINHFVAKESKPKGLFTKLPWTQRASCQDAGLGAIVRMEFPQSGAFATDNEIKGVLFVFRPGSPSPIYETPAVTMEGQPRQHPGDDEDFEADLVADILEYSALSSVVRILVHDWQKL